MKSVTQRIKEVKQPIGGYVNPKDFEVIKLEDNLKLYDEENIAPGLVGLAVDYLTRFINSGNATEAFKISLMGAKIVDEYEHALELLSEINDLDNQSIINACKLCGYDVCYRAGMSHFKNVDEIVPDENTIFNIKCMVKRGITFFNIYGPIVNDGITFEGGYTDVVSAGDADFITSDTLWDFKVSTNPPTKNYTLQLIIYYLLGIHSNSCDFSSIEKIGIFNPRLNSVYQYEIKNISSDTIKEIENFVIGYSEYNSDDIIENNETKILSVSDLMKILECSRHMIMKYYSEYDLPLQKDKNKFFIHSDDFYTWYKNMQKLEEAEERQQEIVIALVIVLLLFLLLFLFW